MPPGALLAWEHPVKAAVVVGWGTHPLLPPICNPVAFQPLGLLAAIAEISPLPPDDICKRTMDGKWLMRCTIRTLYVRHISFFAFYKDHSFFYGITPSVHFQCLSGGALKMSGTGGITSKDPGESLWREDEQCPGVNPLKGTCI